MNEYVTAGGVDVTADNKPHQLKTLPEWFELMIRGLKPYEVRVNDRDYHAGDLLILDEWLDGQYTGRRVYALVLSVNGPLDNLPGVETGFVVMGIRLFRQLISERPQIRSLPSWKHEGDPETCQ